MTNDSRQTYLYDSSASGYTENYIDEKWNGAWVKTTNTIFTYDRSYDNLSVLYQAWSNNAWADSAKEEYIYDY